MFVNLSSKEFFNSGIDVRKECTFSSKASKLLVCVDSMIIVLLYYEYADKFSVET